MDSPVILNDQEQVQLLSAIESAVHVRRRHQFFLWSQGQLFSLLPHEILVCLRPDGERGASHVECLHSMIFDDVREAQLCHPRSGLAVRLAHRALELDRLPAILDGADTPPTPGFESFRDELAAAGLRNALIHGHRVSGRYDASLFILFNLSGAVEAVHGHLITLLLPYLHLAFHHVIGDPGDGSPAAAPPVTERELQILQWVCNGKSNHEISMILGISPLTVKNHLQRVFRKLDVHNRTQAVSAAIALKLLPAVG